MYAGRDNVTLTGVSNMHVKTVSTLQKLNFYTISTPGTKIEEGKICTDGGISILLLCETKQMYKWQGLFQIVWNMNFSAQYASQHNRSFTSTVTDEKSEPSHHESTVPEIYHSILATCSALMLINTVIGIPANIMICAAVAVSK